MPDHGLGYLVDHIDHRDHPFTLTAPARLPPRVDLRSGLPPVWDQSTLGSCVAHALGAALEYDETRQHEPDLMPSRLWIYYQARLMEGTVLSDAGCMIRDAVKAVGHVGYAPEADWPYQIDRFQGPPPVGASSDALTHLAIEYQRVTNQPSIIEAAVAGGFPVVFGCSVYASFESAAVAQTGQVPMPQPGEELLGGHAMLICGYDHLAKRWIVRNSWGGYGDQGYLYIPYRYTSTFASDLWVVRRVS